MHRHVRSQLLALSLLATLLLGEVGIAPAADRPAIDLTDQPVATGSSLAPNILIAVDNSGSMDWETMFDSSFTSLHLAKNGLLPVSGKKGYAYLFPNGHNSNGGRIYGSSYAAIPPIPQYAFARSSVYNRAYFDPGIAVDGGYTPWVEPSAGSDIYPSLESEALWKKAPYDPTQKPENFTVNLTESIKSEEKDYTFYVTSSMSSYRVTYKDVCDESEPDTVCPKEWQTDESPDATFGFSGESAIEYFPATFYMPGNWTPPAAFGWSGAYDNSHPNDHIVGWTPNEDKTLKRYKIVPDNFIDQAHYAKAMTAFANWFTYYRKRHLAVRGGIVAAFENLHDSRVGACTISQAKNRVGGNYENLSMRDLDKNNERKEFYNTIYGMDFYHTQNTPNRAALYYLGEELEHNPDIIQSACQQNYAILFTDGRNNESLSASIGNVDGDGDSDGDGDYGPPFADDASGTMADIAMEFYKNLELDSTHPVSQSEQGNMPVEDGCYQASPPKYLDCERHLHMTTFGVTLGQRGKLFNPDDEKQDPYTNYPDWSKLGTMGPNDGIEQIDDLWHATINSRGALLDAASPQALASRFTSVINQILGRGETLTNATGNGTSLTIGSLVFQTRYSTQNWTGNLIASGAQDDGKDADATGWQAASELNDLDPDERTIITAIESGDGVKGAPFTYGDLKDKGIDGLSASTIAYLRGDRSQEKSEDGSGKLRKRGDTVLGDIVHSVPAFVGRPNPLRYAGTWHDTLYPNLTPPEKNTYYDPSNSDSFAALHADREPIVYVGANDGMLHGFDADNGEEKLAYIPNAVLGSLAGGDNPLTSPSYRHRSFVDGQIATGPAFFDSTWHTMLVGGLRNGGKSIYALDITDPKQFKQSNAANFVSWEFPASDPDADASGLGKTYGKPSIVRLHNGQWAAIFANGYNSADQEAALYIVDIETGKQIGRLKAESKSDTSDESNGLATPFPVDIDGDHITDYVYAGDLHGNVWRFDLTSQSEEGWSVDKIFKAERDGQPITTQVQVASHPKGIGYGVMIYFGTGQDIKPLGGDSAADPNSFYGIWDPDVFSYAPDGAAPPRPDDWTVARDQLVQQSPSTIDPDQGVDGLSYRTVTDNPITFIKYDDDEDKMMFADRGWVIDLGKDSGEAILNPPRIVDDNVQFTTTVINREACTLTSSGFFMAVSRVNGGPPAKDIFDVNGDGVVNDNDASTPRVAGIGFGSGRGSPGQGPSFNDVDKNLQIVKTPLTGGGTGTITLARDFLNGRLSWHEIRR